MISNEVTNQNDTGIIINKGFIASRYKYGSLKLRGEDKSLPLLDSVNC